MIEEGKPAPDFELTERQRRDASSCPTCAASRSSSTSIPRTTRPAARLRRAGSATSTASSSARARSCSASRRTTKLARQVQGRSTTCRSRCSPTRTTRSPRSTASGARRSTWARRTWAIDRSTFVIAEDGTVKKVMHKVKPARTPTTCSPVSSKLSRREPRGDRRLRDRDERLAARDRPRARGEHFFAARDARIGRCRRTSRRGPRLRTSPHRMGRVAEELQLLQLTAVEQLEANVVGDPSGQAGLLPEQPICVQVIARTIRRCPAALATAAAAAGERLPSSEPVPRPSWIASTHATAAIATAARMCLPAAPPATGRASAAAVRRAAAAARRRPRARTTRRSAPPRAPPPAAGPGPTARSSSATGGGRPTGPRPRRPRRRRRSSPPARRAAAIP